MTFPIAIFVTCASRWMTSTRRRGLRPSCLACRSADRTESQAMFRSDARNYAICFSRPGDGEAVALTVAERADLDRLAERLTAAGHSPRRLDAAAAAARQAKEVLAVAAPNGVMVEIVWRPLTSGWRYHGPRDAGIVELQAVSIASNGRRRR